MKFVVIAFMAYPTLAAADPSTPQQTFDTACKANERITSQNAQELLGKKWKGTFKAQIESKNHVLWKDACSGTIEVEFIPLPGPAENFRPPSTLVQTFAPPEIGYHFTPNFDRGCLNIPGLDKILGKGDAVRCKSPNDFRGVHLSSGALNDPSEIYDCTPIGKGVWTALPVTPTVCKKSDGSKLWLEVAAKGHLPIRVFYDLPAMSAPSAPAGTPPDAAAGK